MATRHSTIKSKDRKIFKRTAVNTKMVNLVPTSMRGGTRL